MTKLISFDEMVKIKIELQEYLKEIHPDIASKISISVDQKLDLIQVELGLYTISDEDSKRLRKSFLKSKGEIKP